MKKLDLDLDDLLGEWAAQNGLSRPQSQAVRNAVVARGGVDPLHIYHWWTDLTRMVVRHATTPLHLNFG